MLSLYQQVLSQKVTFNSIYYCLLKPVKREIKYLCGRAADGVVICKGKLRSRKFS